MDRPKRSGPTPDAPDGGVESRQEKGEVEEGQNLVLVVAAAAVIAPRTTIPVSVASGGFLSLAPHGRIVEKGCAPE